MVGKVGIIIMFDFSGKVVLVTGGSRGIGAEICRKFAIAGANVIVNYNSSPGHANDLVNWMNENYPGNHKAVQLMFLIQVKLHLQ